jgi:two-component system, sporulation sensor kinase D
MKIFSNTLLFKRITILVSFIIVSLILWNTYTFFQKFKYEERIKMEILATALKEITANKDLNASVSLPLKIIENNSNIPMILVDEEGNIENYQNLDSVKALSSKYIENILTKMKSENTPIEVSFSGQNKQYI